jgi:predicted metal-dependent phosphoesterase TrpH
LHLKIDFHVHTDQSPDSSITIPNAIAVAKKKGLQGLVITNHDSVTDLTRYYEEDFLLVPGIEITTADGHLLGVGVTQPIPKNLPANQTAQKIREVGGLAVVPHPFAVFAKSIHWQIMRNGEFDGLEVVNASYALFGNATRKGARLAEQLGLPQTGGSDSHIPETIGDAYTIAKMDHVTIEGLIEAVNLNRVQPVGSATRLLFQLKKAYSIAKLHLK